MPSAEVGHAYSQQLTLTGGIDPVQFVHYFSDPGVLPQGVSLSTSGLLSGTPTTAGSYTFSIMAEDIAHRLHIQAITIVVADAVVLSVTPTALPDGRANKAYSQQLTASGGTAPYTFALKSGALPDGLTLSSSGLISGTPKLAGDATLKIGVMDSANHDTSISLPISIAAAPVVSCAVTSVSFDANGSKYERVSLPVSGSITRISGSLKGLSASGVGTSKLKLKAMPERVPAGETLVSEFKVTVDHEGDAVVCPLTISITGGFDMEAVEDQVTSTLSNNQLPSALNAANIFTGNTGSSGSANIQQAGENGVAMSYSTSLAAMGAASSAAETLAATPVELPYNVWIDSRFTVHFKDGDEEHWGSSGSLAIGADNQFTDSLLLGVGLYLDWLSDETDTTKATGTGIMVGPYMALDLTENLELRAALLYGRTASTLDAEIDDRTFSGDFDGDRLVFSSVLAGQMNFDALVLRPNASFALAHGTTEAFAVTDDNGDTIEVDAQEATLIRTGFGASLEYAYLLDGGQTLTPRIGASFGAAGSDSADLEASLFGQAFIGFTLSHQSWQLNGTLQLDTDTTGLTAVSAKGGLSASF